MRDRAEVARKAHNLEVVGSIPTPATKNTVGWTSGKVTGLITRNNVRQRFKPSPRNKRKISKIFGDLKNHLIFVKQLENKVKLK